ncbi:hypothetical protein HY991_01495 [Candidatus Micrarchaeota archaeon]|nr:hypothetical protein [Candidatus Micrarchaeota archaeon]
MALYITTSRKPSQLTRRFVKWLEFLLEGEAENRGKRNIEEIAERARGKGFARILFVYEKKGNPERLCFYENGWLEPEVLIKGVILPKGKPDRRKLKLQRGISVTAEDEVGREIKGLLGFEGEGGKEVRINRERISFLSSGKEIGLVIRISGLRTGKLA